MNTIKVLSYNIHKGFDSLNYSIVIDEIRSAIRKVGANIVFLQEIYGKFITEELESLEWPNDSQLEFLADSIWTHYSYGKNAARTHGHYGNAILSMFPIIQSENINISMSGLEERGILHSIIEIPESKQRIHLLCLHFGLFEAWREKQALELCKRIENFIPHHEPLLVAGDFNDWREILTNKLKTKVNLEEAFLSIQNQHAKTFPSWLPLLKLDRVYYRGLKIKTAQTLVGEPWNRLSDHIPLYIELEI